VYQNLYIMQNIIGNSGTMPKSQICMYDYAGFDSQFMELHVD